MRKVFPWVNRDRHKVACDAFRRNPAARDVQARTAGLRVKRTAPTIGSQHMITLINVFKVQPTNQDRVLELLTRATDEFVISAPGFVASTLHRSLDGTKVTMVAQWRSVGDYEVMRRDPGPLPFFEEALTIATFEPGIYEAVRTFSPAV
jgi:quinol monooxygenase YgiN